MCMIWKMLLCIVYMCMCIYICLYIHIYIYMRNTCTCKVVVWILIYHSHLLQQDGTTGVGTPPSSHRISVQACPYLFHGYYYRDTLQTSQYLLASESTIHLLPTYEIVQKPHFASFFEMPDLKKIKTSDFSLLFPAKPSKPPSSSSSNVGAPRAPRAPRSGAG